MSVLTRGREKRHLSALMALLAPLPLPFNQMLEWPVLFAYALFLVYFMQRVERGEPVVLPNWALNLVGLAYLPIFYLDLRASLASGRVVAALLHLVMFLLVAKLFSMRRESDKWHLFLASFFLFVGSMATSTHVTVALYLLGFLGLTLVVLGRFAHLHLLAESRPRDAAPAAALTRLDLSRVPGVPYRGALVAGLLLVTAIAIPTFATLPRLRDPYILGPGGGSASLIRTTGFSDSVDLSLTTSIRTSRDVVLRLRYLDDEDRFGEDLRFKGGVFDFYRENRWHRLRGRGQARVLRRDEAGLFELVPETPAATVEIFREQLNSASLLLPMETVAVSIPGVRYLSVDSGGAVYLPGMPPDTIRYEARLASGPRIAAVLDSSSLESAEPLSALDPGGVSERMRQLASQVMGEGSASERAARLENHLLSEYAYSLDLLGLGGDDPIEEFLFETKSGHCELFASAMVLLLRAEGIPARLAAGYLGAEYNPLEGYFMVRQENAHAWVEAHVGGTEGWRVYDPTPPEGRPAVREGGVLRFAGQLYDYLTFRWDRWVLTFGADDQRGFFESVRNALTGLWSLFFDDGEAPAEGPGEELPGGVRGEDGVVLGDPQSWLGRVPVGIVVTLFLFFLGGLFAWQTWRPLRAAEAYGRLRRRLAGAGVPVDAALAPLELRDLTAARHPAAALPARRLIELYLGESFGGQELSREQRRSLRDLLGEVSAALREEKRTRRHGSLETEASP